MCSRTRMYALRSFCFIASLTVLQPREVMCLATMLANTAQANETQVSPRSGEDCWVGIEKRIRKKFLLRTQRHQIEVPVQVMAQDQ